MSQDPRRQAFDAAPAAILIVDPVADAVLDANRAATLLLGTSEAELRRASMVGLHPGQRPALVVFTQAVLAKGEYWTRTLSPRHRDGRPLEVEYAGTLIGGGAAPRLMLTLTDLAQRRQRDLDREAELFMEGGLDSWLRSERVFREIERANQLILRAAGEGIYGVNAEGVTTFINPAAERMLGWLAEEIVGRDMHASVHHSHPDGTHYPHTACPIYGAFRNGAVHRVDDEVFWRRDGTSFPVEYTSTPIRHRGRIVGAVIVFRDVSQRREAEERLRRALVENEGLRRKLELENAYLQEEIRREGEHHEILGRSPAIRRLLEQIALVAPTGAAVLVSGESGTGKELVARAIHHGSGRRDQPLIRVNCATIPRELFESEFFGHAKGAFTGAVRDRIGRFELADGGTLFLDEVGEIPTELQPKLLRVLQEGQFERVGEERTRTVDVRIIAATNRDLESEVAARRFRKDLYYRLNVFPIGLRPLRERREDVPMLASHFLRLAAGRLRVGELRLTEGDCACLSSYDWPGNIRELQNVVERAAILAQDGRPRFDLPSAPMARAPMSPPIVRGAASGVFSEADRRDRDRANIVAALDACGGKVFGKDGAAERLGLKPTTLASRMKALGIPKVVAGS